MPARHLVLGIDGGTESLRAGLFDAASGAPLAFGVAPYPTTFPHPSWAEQQPDDWWEALGAAVRSALSQAGAAAADVAALALDTTCCTVVALDAEHRPLRPALLWMDVRASAEADAVAACGDAALRVNGGGQAPVSAEWMLPKALWLKRHEPGVWAAAKTLCEYQDYLNLRLTGRRVASVNNASVRWHYSTATGACGRRRPSQAGS